MIPVNAITKYRPTEVRFELVFTGLTAYDAQKLMRASSVAESQDEDVFQKASIIGALELYLDFINIFLALLRLFGKGRGRR